MGNHQVFDQIGDHASRLMHEYDDCLVDLVDDFAPGPASRAAVRAG
jgi:hypothetical protein